VLAGLALIAGPSLAEPVPRMILALYDGRVEPAPHLTRLHRFAEAPLAHLGFVLDYRDANAPLPEPGALSRYRGILSWLSGPLADPARHLLFLERAASTGLRLVVLGEIGAPLEPRFKTAIDRVTGHLGLVLTGERVASPLGARTIVGQGALVGAECAPDAVPPPHPVARPVRADVTVALAVASPRSGPIGPASVVATSPRGGYAAEGYVLCGGPAASPGWLVEPFGFFAAALGPIDGPVPDVTTLSGRRIYLATVEVDDLAAAPALGGASAPRTSVGELLQRDLIEAFPGLPVTLVLRQGSGPVAHFRTAPAVARGEAGNLEILAPERAALRLAPAQSRLDGATASLTRLSALVAPGPGGPRVRAALAPEVAYRSGAAGGDSHYLLLAATIKRTETPRRLRAIHIGLEASALARADARAAVLAHLARLEGGGIAPVAASRYAAMVRGFLSARIERAGPRAWTVLDRGALETVRFERAERLDVDLAASRGVLGARRHAGSLYVALDSAVDPVRIVLADGNSATGVTPPALDESRWRVSRLAAGACRLEFAAQGYGAGAFAWRGARPGAWRIGAMLPDGTAWSATATAADDGTLRFTLPPAAAQPVAVTLDCVEKTTEVGG
jgi:hypothetical protein